MGKLTEEQKAFIKRDFHEFSDGFHPGEAGEERDRYIDEHEDEYPENALQEFLDAWGEEESEKDLKRHSEEQSAKAKALKKKLHEIAKSCVSINEHRTQVTVKVEDVTLHLPVHQSKTKAKAEWADCVWMIECLLKQGAKEFHESGLLDPEKE